MEYQVVILAGGESSRFFPFNELHKSFFKIAGKTVLERTVASVKKTYPSGILLVLGAKNFDKEKEICEANPVFENVKYIREEAPLGQADAILSAKEFIKDDFFVVNANQFNFHKIADGFVAKHEESGDMATVGITKTETPNKYGIVDLDGDKIRGVVEKPEPGSEKSDMRLVGVYLFSKDFLSRLTQSKLSEYSLEDTLDQIAKESKVASVSLSEGIPSLKYPWDILGVKDLILTEMNGGKEDGVIIEKTAVLKGDNIYFGKNAHVYDFAIIEGPAYIGDDAVVGSYSQIRGGSVIEKGGQAERYCDVRNSIIGENTHIHSGFVGDSVIGKDCRIGAEFITANKRLDRAPVKVKVKDEKVDSGKVNLGVFVGDGVKAGIRVSTMPGTLVGNGSNIYPGVSLSGLIGEGAKVTE